MRNAFSNYSITLPVQERETSDPDNLENYTRQSQHWQRLSGIAYGKESGLLKNKNILLKKGKSILLILTNAT